jgi:hypothetical protein
MIIFSSLTRNFHFSLAFQRLLFLCPGHFLSSGRQMMTQFFTICHDNPPHSFQIFHSQITPKFDVRKPHSWKRKFLARPVIKHKIFQHSRLLIMWDMHIVTNLNHEQHNTLFWNCLHLVKYVQFTYLFTRVDPKVSRLVPPCAQQLC